MIPRRRLVEIGVALASLAVVQVGLVAWLPTGPAAPDLVAALAVALALAGGPLVGGVAGAMGGLAIDLVPPATGPVGAWMLVLATVAWLAGAAAAAGRPGPVASMGLLVLAVVAAVPGRAGVLWFTGVPVGRELLATSVGTAAWALVLAPLALLLAHRWIPGQGAAVRMRTGTP